MRLPDIRRRPTAAANLLVWLAFVLPPGVTSYPICIPSGAELVVSEGVTCQLSPGRHVHDMIKVSGTLVALTDVSSAEFVTLVATVNLEVTPEGVITSAGLGFGPGEGPGAGVSKNGAGSGGSHGGRGGTPGGVFLGAGRAAAYGSASEPDTLGSGGGASAGGRGGGVVHLMANSSITIDGIVTADGLPGGSGAGGGGGGAAGSILLESEFFTGSGLLLARGGNAPKGSGAAGGAGGRISIRFQGSTFDGTQMAHGGQSGDVEAAVSPSSMQASSTASGSSPSHGNLANSPDKSWRPSASNTAQYLTALYATPYHVIAIVTRGDPATENPNSGNYVTEYIMEFKDPDSQQWIPYKDVPSKPPPVIPGNVDSTSHATWYLAFPVYADGIRLRPQTWSGGIGLAFLVYGYGQAEVEGDVFPGLTCDPPEYGEPGGPGTVFIEDQSLGLSEVIVDNVGRKPSVQLTDCVTPNPTQSGAVAWILDSNIKDTLTLRHGAHLVLSATDEQASLMQCDQSSMIHITTGTDFLLGTISSCKMFVEEGANLTLATGAEVSISALLQVEGTVRSDSYNNLIIDAPVTLTQNRLTLNKLDVTHQGRLDHLTEGAALTVDAQVVEVNGTVDLAELHFENLYDLKVLESGLLAFTPIAELQCHWLSVFGEMSVRSSIVMKGHDRDHIDELHIGSGGILKLDSLSQHHRNWSGVSVVATRRFDIDGQFLAGLMNVTSDTVVDDGGWEYLYVNSTGSMHFQTPHTFFCSHIAVHGTLESYTPVDMITHRGDNGLYLTVGEGGNIIFDSQASHPAGPWSGQSRITGLELITGEGSAFQGGLLEVLFPVIVVGGSFTFDPGDIKLLVNNLTVTESGTLASVDRLTMENYEGVQGSLIVEEGGQIYLNSHGRTDAQRYFCNASLVSVSVVMMAGRTDACSMQMDCETVFIPDSGVIDVSEGGYRGGQGPGTGVDHSGGASGGSFGGRGGRGAGALADNLPYCTIYDRCRWGSGGGGSTGTGTNQGGRGGGYLHIKAQLIDFTGRLKANGQVAQANHCGGGSGGSVFLEATTSCLCSGYIQASGGAGRANGGGGSGGRVAMVMHDGHYVSGYIEAKGGASDNAEPGGPGTAHFTVQSRMHEHLRIDNKCQQPQVSIPEDCDSAPREKYLDYLTTGAVTHLLPPGDDYIYNFDLIEIYGAAQLVFPGNRTGVIATAIVGDDTGSVHVGPDQTLTLTEVSPYKRVNVTWAPYIYDDASFILPKATVEFRKSLDQEAEGMSGMTCPSSVLLRDSLEIWGNLHGDNAHVIVGSDFTLTMRASSNRELQFASLTLQDDGIFDLNSNYGDYSDRWALRVEPRADEGDYKGTLTVEGGGRLEARHLLIEAETVRVDDQGVISLDGKGRQGGPGAGHGRTGAGHGGKGGKGLPDDYPGTIYGSVISPRHFGSGGTSAPGGGILEIVCRTTLLVEGSISASGEPGSAQYSGGSSGGSLLLFADTLEGTGTITVSIQRIISYEQILAMQASKAE